MPHTQPCPHCGQPAMHQQILCQPCDQSAQESFDQRRADEDYQEHMADYWAQLREQEREL